MTSYKHKVQYYETDKMGIVHHSNYIRWMEEARVDFLEKIEWSYDQLEKVGLVSPVLSLDIDYHHPSFFGDVISIDVVIMELKMSKMRVGYKMINKEGEMVAPSPCGVCLQVMAEFCDPDSFYIILGNSAADCQKFLLKEVLPFSFGAHNIQGS